MDYQKEYQKWLASGALTPDQQAELEVIAGNAPAMGLYKKLGFEVYGTRPRDLRYKDGTYADAHLMVKML